MKDSNLPLLVLVPFAIFNLILLGLVINLARKQFVEIYKTKGIKPIIGTVLYVCFIILAVIMFDKFIGK